jgi:heme-degrading monooxygenase HmoA
MYTRIVEITSKSGKSRELCNAIEEKVVPILKKQAGFVDETVLVSDADPDQVLGLSFWNSKEDAERYHQEQYPEVHEMLDHLIETEPEIRTFDVQASTTRQITARESRLGRRVTKEKRAPARFSISNITPTKTLYRGSSAARSASTKLIVSLTPSCRPR